MGIIVGVKWLISHADYNGSKQQCWSILRLVGWQHGRAPAVMKTPARFSNLHVRTCYSRNCAFCNWTLSSLISIVVFTIINSETKWWFYNTGWCAHKLNWARIWCRQESFSLWYFFLTSHNCYFVGGRGMLGQSLIVSKHWTSSPCPFSHQLLLLKRGCVTTQRKLN